MTIPPPPSTGSRWRRLGEELASGLRRRDVERLFERDTGRAFEVLADGYRDPGREAQEDDVGRFLLRVRWFFLGLTTKLSPPRRLLFLVSLAIPLFGLVPADFVLGPTRVHVDFSPLWFLLSIAGLILLLALELSDRLVVRDELEVARELQRELLPRREPPVPGFRFAHSYRTANSIGGDYYDFLPLHDGRLAFALGDASGHGLAAGLLMAIASATLKTAVDLDPSPDSVLGLLNRTLYRTGGRREFMTLVYGLLDPESGELDLAVAGHPFPIHRTAAGDVHELGRGGYPLGIRADGSWPALHTTIGHGDVLLLYSDGIPEALGDDGEPFGFDRMKTLLSRAGSPRTLHDRILEAFDRHRGETPLRDDLSLLVLDRSPAPVPRTE